MPIACDPASVVASAAGYDELSERELSVVQTYLLAQILASASGVASSVSQLMTSAASFQALGTEDIEAVQAYLLCQIASVSGA